MKKLSILLTLLAISAVSYGQSRVTQKALIGEWQMVIDVDLDEVEEELENENWLARRIASSVTGLVSDILDEIDIKMDFRPNGEVKIMVEAFGERETDYAEWEINSEGELRIFDEDHRRWSNRHVSFGDDDDIWLMDEGNIVQFERHSRGRMERQEVYLKKIGK